MRVHRCDDIIQLAPGVVAGRPFLVAPVDLLAHPAEAGIARGLERRVAVGVEQVRRHAKVELGGLEREGQPARPGRLRRGRGRLRQRRGDGQERRRGRAGIRQLRHPSRHHSCGALVAAGRTTAVGSVMIAGAATAACKSPEQAASSGAARISRTSRAARRGESSFMVRFSCECIGRL